MTADIATESKSIKLYFEYDDLTNLKFEEEHSKELHVNLEANID